MAFGRSGGVVSAPRTLTVAVSAVIALAVLLSFTEHLPHQLALVRGHRVGLALGAWGVLMAGVLLRKL